MPLNDNEKNLMKYAKIKPKIEPIKIPLVLFKFKLSGDMTTKILIQESSETYQKKHPIMDTIILKELGPSQVIQLNI